MAQLAGEQGDAAVSGGPQETDSSEEAGFGRRVQFVHCGCGCTGRCNGDAETRTVARRHDSSSGSLGRARHRRENAPHLFCRPFDWVETARLLGTAAPGKQNAIRAWTCDTRRNWVVGR